jgi:CDP-2,3-bis-(O-geranylgeranyl)-sn-glycerol synthase
MARGAWTLLPVLGAPALHAPVLRSNRLAALARPIDCGATLRGRRLLGDNKTWRGALVMATGTIAAAHALHHARWFRDRLPPELRDAGPSRYGPLLAIGTVAGELPNSFLKRQFGIAPGGRRWSPAGAVLILVDQADFVAGIWLALRPLWRMPPRDLAEAVAIVVGVHLTLNVVGYAVGARDTPI